MGWRAKLWSLTFLAGHHIKPPRGQTTTVAHLAELERIRRAAIPFSEADQDALLCPVSHVLFLVAVVSREVLPSLFPTVVLENALAVLIYDFPVLLVREITPPAR